MNVYYSKSTGGFYNDAVHSVDQIPADAKKLTAEQYKIVTSETPEGKMISADANGYPVLIDRVDTADELWAKHQKIAKSELDKSDLVALRCWKAGVEYPTEWLARDITLRAIVSASTGDPATTPIPEAPAYPTGT